MLKKDEHKQMVQDCWYLNKYTVWNNYPLPLISQLVNKLKGSLLHLAQVGMSIDLKASLCYSTKVPYPFSRSHDTTYDILTTQHSLLRVYVLLNKACDSTYHEHKITRTFPWPRDSTHTSLTKGLASPSPHFHAFLSWTERDLDPLIYISNISPVNGQCYFIMTSHYSHEPFPYLSLWYGPLFGIYTYGQHSLSWLTIGSFLVHLPWLHHCSLT